MIPRSRAGVVSCSDLRHTGSMKTDVAWFRKTIESSHHGSMRALAKKLKNSAGNEYHYQNLWLVLTGQREMALHLVPQLARELDVSQAEILRRVGLNV